MDLGPPSPQRIGRLDAAMYQVELSPSCARGGRFGGFDLITLQNSPASHTNYRIYPSDASIWLVTDVDGQTILVAIDSVAEAPDFEAAARSVLTSLRLSEG